MIVTLSAVHRQSEECFPGMLHSILKPDVAIVAKPISDQKAGRPQGCGIERGDFIGGQHLMDHAIVRLIRVRRFNNPIAPAPDVRLAFPDLGIVARPIAVAPDIHPMTPPSFPIARTGQQIFDDLEIMPIGGLLGKICEFLRCWRHANQIHVDPPQ